MKRTRDRVVTECGCVFLPDIIERSLGIDWAECDEHGRQGITRLATGREVIEMQLGVTLSDVSDEPPF